MNTNQKLYYSIKEVAEMFGVNESTLRYWEKEFTLLKPKINARGIRQYTDKDIAELRLIHNLLRVRGFKINAAKKMIRSNRDGADKSANIIDTLVSTRDQLIALKQQLDKLS
ncbi:MAG: MerR family transcriptional regulator [Prevotella sp.]|nr:MerR family transcriptional regulator [Prevotella sp.]